VRATDADDVAHVIGLARETGLELAIRCGGHSAAGHGVSDGGIVLDVRDMKRLEIDVDGSTAWAETGLTTSEYTAAMAAHGLATGFGDTGSVGLGGITLGGGVGYLVRKHGLTIDSLIAAEVVTADGRILSVDADNHPDLFWAIRGGGGNFGVATRFLFRLHAVGTSVGGILVLPATPDTVAGFIAAAEAAPEELSTIANVMKAPPMPFLPEEAHGKLVILGMLAYAGDVDAGERVVSPFRELAEPIADMVRAIPYPQMYMPEEEGYHPIGVLRSKFVDSLDRDAAEAIVGGLGASTAQMAVTQIRVLGGAVARVPGGATAFAHRSRRIMMNVAAVFERADEAVEHDAWAAGLAAEIGGDDEGVYVNFLGDEGAGRVREAYPGPTWGRVRDAYPGPTWERLRAIKRRYDPANLFRLNQNIPPAEQ
ncbi:MAG: FAD-binding oxidoreductase, partial [Actinomycetota bacterium]